MNIWEKQKIIDELYDRETASVLKTYGLTQMELTILLFLYENPEFKTAADIVRMRKLTKSGVSVAIRHLMKLGYLIPDETQSDRRSIALLLTEKADLVCQAGEAAQDHFVKVIMQGFSKKETDLLNHFVDRVNDNAEKALNHKKRS